MKLRDLKKTPWVCVISPLFEAAYWSRLASVDPLGYDEVLLNFQELAEKNPFMLGLPHGRLDRIWVFESPALARLPRVAIAYEIDEANGRVILWNCHRLD